MRDQAKLTELSAGHNAHLLAAYEGRRAIQKQLMINRILLLQVREQAKLTELSAGYTAHLLAVCAAARASADGETAAKSAATKAYTAEWKAYRKSSGTGSRPLPASSTARQVHSPSFSIHGVSHPL